MYTTTITTMGTAQINITDSIIEVKTADTTVTFSICASIAPLKRKKPLVAPIRINLQAFIIEAAPKRIRPKIAAIPTAPTAPTAPTVPTATNTPSVELNSYTPAEVDAMDDYELAKEFIRITGCYELSCTHCKGARPIVPFWMASIRKRCMKKSGLCASMAVPLTCDAQQSRNASCNPINNPIYSKLRSNKINNEDKIAAIKLREESLDAIGLAGCPYRYKAD